MNDSPARTDPEEAAIGPPAATARRLVEASVSPNTRRAYGGALRRLDAWLDGRELHDVTLAAQLDAWLDGRELHDVTLAVPRRAARRRPRLVERLYSGRCGVLPREAGRAAHSRRRAAGPGAGRVPADRLRSGARTSAAVRGLGPGGRARYLPSAAAARARRRILRGRPRTGPVRCGDRWTAVHGGDAAQRGERPALGRRRRFDRR